MLCFVVYVLCWFVAHIVLWLCCIYDSCIDYWLQLYRYIPWYTVLYIFCEVRIRVRVGVIISVQGLFAVLSCVGVGLC